MATPPGVVTNIIKYNDTTVYNNNSSWTNSAYRIIKITKDTSVSPAFYNWFMANTTKMPKLSSVLNDNSWADIATAADLGIGQNYWSVGDTKEVTLNGSVGYGGSSYDYDSRVIFDQLKYWVYIIGFDHNSAKEGKGIAFQGFKTAQTDGIDIAVTAANYNSTGSGIVMNNTNTNVGGWTGSAAYKTIMTQWKISFTPDLQKVIKSTMLSTDDVGNSSTAASSIKVSTNEVYYLAEYEVFGVNKYANTNEPAQQAQYAYYKAGNSKVKYHSDNTSTAATWWLRSSDRYISGNFCSVGTDGSAVRHSAYASYGFAPCFKVGIPGKASPTPQSGVTYTTGLNHLSPDMISYISKCISNNGNITNETTTIYYDDSDYHHSMISVGDQVTIALNGTNYIFDVIGFNHDYLADFSAYGTTTRTNMAGITFQMHDCFATTYKMNSSNTNVGGWKESLMRTSTMPLMKGYMPAEWQAIIKTCRTASGTGGGSTGGQEIVYDDCFLLSEIEIFGYTTNSVSGGLEGVQYAYYKAGNSKIKKRSGSSYEWWERSPNSGNSAYFCDVNFTGGATKGQAAASLGVAFAFCV